ncbi:MAG TPA: ABC transporter permease [Candidatus Acidoferrum sp.]|nr:ABC transporter permease [Candidatus Acidoferrum sp.]
MKHNFTSTLSNKIIIVILGLIVLTYFLFVALPVTAIFLRIDPSQVNVQLHNAQIIDTIQLSLYTSAVATLIAFVLAVPTAYFMATRKFPGKAVIDTIIDLPIVLPPAVAGVALLYAFAPKGLLGPILNNLGITIPGYTIAVIIAEAFVASPFLLRSAKTGFESVDKDVINSAKMLTGSHIRVFFTVTFPLSIRAVVSGSMMTWARALGEFGATLMFAGNLPGITQTMPLAIYVFLYSDPLAGVMLSIILIAIAFAVLITIKLIEQKKFGQKK